MLLDGKVALVTGASRGIGRAIALKLASEGAKVAINYAGNTAKAEAVTAEIEAAGGEAMLVQADVSDAAQVDAMVKTVAEAFGTIDILVNNAGITRDGLLMRMKEEDFDAVLNTNLKGVFHCTKAVSRLMMKKRYGRIVNMASVVGLMGNAGQTNYAAAKAGVMGFSKSAARELASRGITVNTVAPGCINTDMTAVLPDKVKEGMLQSIPLQRIGEPEDVANAVLFLASDLAAYITGQNVDVDGGMVM
ncbi:MAG: 3-oxoacyl-[acyl-carrier-protein] reductase [Selenomonadaceae bacterium]|nr:3-oxoacyl-[acyl-carrier-protein] reductase [Selenomonadaceae bacterium]MDD7056061.1 3-oxoacyl-[acyl-carrier-protein] reductase [Selenomonadaceae bacterium]MDY3916255.1 3-oxoacyl-[acyl-carrier-protein] reductase [Selenomonadaceae bacterium]